MYIGKKRNTFALHKYRNTTYMSEIWKDIKGCDGIYQVSSLGNVKSLERISLKKGKHPFILNGKTLKLRKNTHGYLQFGTSVNGVYKIKLVHKEVAISFLNHTPCGQKLVVNHINHIRTDNRVENLEIVTQRENANKKHLKSSSKYTGVCWCKTRNKWTSNISINRKRKFLGYYKNEIDAHNAYQKALTIITE